MKLLQDGAILSSLPSLYIRTCKHYNHAQYETHAKFCHEAKLDKTLSWSKFTWDEYIGFLQDCHAALT